MLERKIWHVLISCTTNETWKKYAWVDGNFLNLGLCIEESYCVVTAFILPEVVIIRSVRNESILCVNNSGGSFILCCSLLPKHQHDLNEIHLMFPYLTSGKVFHVPPLQVLSFHFFSAISILSSCHHSVGCNLKNWFCKLI